MTPDPAADPPGAADARELARLRRAVACSSDGFWERHLPSNQSWYSPGFKALFGFADDELPNDRNVVNARIHAGDRAGFLERYEQALRRCEPFQYELRYRHREGHWVWVRGRGRVWPGAEGTPEYITGAVWDITAEKAAVETRERLAERLEHALRATGVGVFERRLGDDHLYADARLWELLGYGPQELLASRDAFVALLHPDDREPYLHTVREALPTLARLSFTGRMRCKSGEYRWFQQDAQAHRLTDGSVRVVGVLADVHDQVCARSGLEQAVADRTASLRAALEQAERARAGAEEATAAKSRFLAHMSHEIRTPLTGVLGLTELALREADKPALRRYLEIGQQSGLALQAVIDDVLEFSRLEAGAPTVAAAPFDLAETLAQALRSTMPLVRATGLAMRYDWDGEPTWFVGDAGRIRQIVVNLVANAAKFTPSGHVDLLARVDPGAASGVAAVTIDVRDTGPGMEPALQERIFDAFEQGDVGLARRFGGAGLGLAIARGFARAMGGDITVASELGRGSTFTVTLPLPVAVDPDPPPRPAPGLAWVVHPHRDEAAWPTQRLARLGWACEPLPSLEAALAQAASPARRRPDLVVIAESALVADGPLERLARALPRAHLVAAIRPDWYAPRVEARLDALGIERHVVPLTPRTLAQMLARAPRPAAVGADSPGHVHGDVLLVEDNPVNRLIGEESLRSLGLDVRSAADGEEAIAACLAQAPGVVLMDLQMPGIDGLEATRRLRALQAEGRLPAFAIVALSAHALPDDRRAAAAAGVDDYLTKPFQIEALRALVTRLLAADGAAR